MASRRVFAGYAAREGLPLALTTVRGHGMQFNRY
jgi:hypothetical protein